MYRGLDRWEPALLDADMIGFVPGDARYESRDRFENGFGLIALRRVTAIRKSENHNRSCTLLRDGFHLGHGSVLVVEALNHEDRAGNAREIFFDGPAAEVGMKPDVVPSPEGSGGVAMMTGEFLRHVCGPEFHFGFGDASHAEALDKNVRRKKDKTKHAIVGSSVDESDGGSVAVADQDGFIDFELPQKIGESSEGFVVHVGYGASFGEQV